VEAGPGENNPANQKTQPAAAETTAIKQPLRRPKRNACPVVYLALFEPNMAEPSPLKIEALAAWTAGLEVRGVCEMIATSTVYSNTVFPHRHP